MNILQGLTNLVLYGSFNISNKRLALIKNYRLFKTNNALFIHIPKSAGISLSNAIYGKDSYGHISINDYCEYIGSKSIEKMFKFTIVRNPYDRLRSAFFYLKKGGRGNKLDIEYQKIVNSYQSFEDFVEKYFAEHNLMEVEHFIPQVYWITNKENNVAVDYIGKFENLNNEFKIISNKIPGKVKRNTLPKKNITSTKRNYEINNNTAEIIYNLYKDDFEIFGYDKVSFEN